MPTTEELKAEQLRSELASIFGTSAAGTSRSSESFTNAPGDEKMGLGSTNFSRTEDGASSVDVGIEQRDVDTSSESGETGQSGFAEEEEISVDAYMARLLARSRGSAVPESNCQQTATRHHTSEIDGTEPTRSRAGATSALSSASNGHDTSESGSCNGTVSTTSRKPVEVNPKELRAELNSFRQLANESARSAVARSIVEREQLHLQQMTIATGIAWAVTLSLFVVGFCLGSAVSVVSILAVIGSAAVSVITFRMRLASKKRKADNSEPLSSDQTSGDAVSEDSLRALQRRWRFGGWDFRLSAFPFLSKLRNYGRALRWKTDRRSE